MARTRRGGHRISTTIIIRAGGNHRLFARIGERGELLAAARKYRGPGGTASPAYRRDERGCPGCPEDNFAAIPRNSTHRAQARRCEGVTAGHWLYHQRDCSRAARTRLRPDVRVRIVG